jgi:hypothetical protein
MTPKIKNIIIFVVVAAVLIFAYLLFFKPAPQEANLTTSSGNSALPSTSASGQNTATIGADFLATLLSVKNITLDDSIFTDPTFATLHDSSITLVPDQTQGRPNPFAPIGTDVLPTTNTSAGTLTQQ